MGKKKQFDKQRSIVFKLIPAVDKNNQSRIMFQAVVPKRSKLTEKEKQEIIKEFSNEHEFEAKDQPERDDRFAGVPPEILEKIRGRTDLIINGKSSRGREIDLDDEDFGEEVDEKQVMDNIQEYEEFMIEEGEDDEEDFDEEKQLEEERGGLKYGGELDEDDDQSWETDSEQGEEIEEEEEIKEVKETKPSLQNFEEDFPELPEPGTAPAVEETEEKQLSKLSKKQLEILNGILPKNYEDIKISNVQMKKFDSDGNPIDGYDYSQHFSKGKVDAVAKFEVQFIVPTEPDVDIVSEKLPAGGREVDEAMEKAEIYDPLEDDFFIKLMKLDNVKVEEKEGKKSNKVESKVESKQKMTGIGIGMRKKEESKEEFTEDELFKMMNQMRGVPGKKEEFKDGDDDADYEDVDDEDDGEDDGEDMDMDDIEDDDELKEGEEEEDEREFHQLNKRERRIFMKNYKIPEVEDLAKEELRIKMKTFKGAKPQEIHLKTIHPKIPFSQDTAMQDTMNKGSDTSDIQTMSEASDNDDDIVSYHTKHSTVSSSVNFIMEQGKKRQKKSTPVVSQTKPQISKPEQPLSEKRDRNQTKQQKKLRKQQLKDFKKDKRESKKQFMEELKAQKKIVDNNNKAALHGVSHINFL